jgi:Domain of unknown function (DUF4157)
MAAFSRPPTPADHRVAPAKSGYADPGKHTLVPQLDASVVQRQAVGSGARDDASAHAAASRGIATPASALPYADTVQRLFGRHDISAIQAHTGGEAAASASAMGADAYATGNHVVLGGGTDLHTVAHEAAHVVQQRGGVQLEGSVGAAGDAYEQHADAVADRVVAGNSAERLLDHGAGAASAPGHAVQRREDKDDAKILANQASLKNTDVEIPALEGALLATRKEAVKQGLLSQASFDAGLALSQAMTQLQPAVAAKGAVDPWQQQLAAFAAQRLFASLQRETADDKNFKLVPSPGGASTAVTSQNPYTEELRVTTYLLWRPIQNTASWLAHLPDLIRQGKWDDAFGGYRRMLDGFDLWVADQLRKKGKGTPEEALGNAQQHHAQLHTGLEQIADKHALRLPALFHPDAKIVETEKAAGRPAAGTIAMNVYFWKDDRDGTFHLYDLTTPSRPHEQTIDGPPTAAMMNTFFEEVARYPEGEVRYALPGGAGGVALTTGKTKWYEWVGYAGLAIAGVGLALLTGGASIPATVCFAVGAIAGGVSAGGHLVDTARLGTATSATVVLDVAQIVATFASFGAMSITVKAGGAAAALAGSRWFVPLAGTAVGAEVVQLVALADLTVVELTKIQHGAGTPEDKQRAMAVLVTQLVVMSGLTALSVQGARSAGALADQQLEVVEQNGARVLRVVGEDAAALVGAPETAPSSTRTSPDAPLAERSPAPGSVPAHHLPAPQANVPGQAVEVVRRHQGSVRGALAELNQLGFTQPQMREALETAWRSTGRATAGALTADDGTLVLLSRRVGPNQPVNLIRPNGTAEFGTGELFFDPSNLQSPIGVRNVRTGDGTPLRMHGEPSTSNSPGPALKPPAEAEAGVLERLEDLARDPDHGDKVTDQTRREAKVALDLERQGKLKAPVRRPVPGDGHSGDFVDGSGGDWDVKAYKSRQSIIDSIRARAVARDQPVPRMDPTKPVPGEFELETAMQQLRAELRSGERLIIDAEGLGAEDLDLLKEAVKREKLDAQVIFHE